MKFYLSTYYDGQVPMLSKDGFERGSSIYSETLWINQKGYTLTEFREKFDAEKRREIICRYLTTEDDIWSPDDYTVKQWEDMLMEELKGDGTS